MLLCIRLPCCHLHATLDAFVCHAVTCMQRWTDPRTSLLSLAARSSSHSSSSLLLKSASSSKSLCVTDRQIKQLQSMSEILHTTSVQDSHAKTNKSILCCSLYRGGVYVCTKMIHILNIAHACSVVRFAVVTCMYTKNELKFKQIIYASNYHAITSKLHLDTSNARVRHLRFTLLCNHDESQWEQ